jgi:hypothetical protein
MGSFGASTLMTLLVSAPLVGWAQAPEAKSSKAVLVTGASTLIGCKITERLARSGADSRVARDAAPE